MKMNINHQVVQACQKLQCEKAVTKEARCTANKLMNLNALKQMFSGVTGSFMYTCKNISQNCFQLPIQLHGLTK